MYLVLGLVLLALGLLLAIKPQVFFELTESWKGSRGEPSSLYLWSTRLGGALMIAVGVASAVVHFLR